MERPSWNKYFMDIAATVATRSTCVRRQVGAIAVNPENHTLIATGYNGPPSGFNHCTKHTCYRTMYNIPSGEMPEKCYAIHAEQNLICYAGRELQGSLVVVTHQPCITCFKMLISAGVSQIIWSNPYPDKFAEEMMYRMGSIATIEGRDYKAMSWTKLM